MSGMILLNGGNGSQSPFDSIRRVDESGVEYWTARDLMKLLEFKQWQKFSGTIDIAKENLESSGINSLEHFLPYEVKSQGRPKLDYHLSRLACYHTVLACDSRGKPLVRRAKHYFAVKTREAETVIPQISEDLQKLQLENENMRLKLQVYEAQQKTLAAAGMLSLTAPAIAEAIICPGVTIINKVEKQETTVLVDRSGNVVKEFSGVGITAIQKRYGFTSTKQAWQFLESIGYGKESSAWKEEQSLVTHPKLSRENLKEVDRQFKQRFGDRQILLGE